MSEIRIFGYSDDLIEVEGAIVEEFNHYGSEPWTGLLAGPEYGALHVHAWFTQIGVWAVGVSQVPLAPGEESGNPIPPWPIRIEQAESRECEYSAVLIIDAPDGSTLTEVKS